MPQLRTRRRLVSYESFGNGRTPLLLIHGNFASPRWWRGLGRHLPRRFIAHAPALPGFAGDPLGFDRITIGALAEDVLAFADALELERFHLAGHSLGSAVAMELALRHPERVASLILVAPIPAGGLAVLIEESRALRRFDPRRPFAGAELELCSIIARVLGLHRPALTRTLVEMAPSLESDPELPMFVEDAAAMTPRAIVEMFGALARFDPEPRLAELAMPTLVIAGEEDRLIPIRHARDLVLRLPCAALLSYPGVAHGVPLAVPRALASSLARFVWFGRRWLLLRRWLCSAIRPILTTLTDQA